MTIEGSESSIPEDRAERVRMALNGAHEALKLARREGEGAAEDTAHLAWVAVGLVSALKGAMIAALSGYDTALPGAVRDPSHAERIAPVTLLLRRVRSDAYLTAPERVELSASRMRAIERVVAVRNGAVHAMRADIPATFASDARTAISLIENLVLTAPAFDPAPVRVLSALIADEIRALRKVLPESISD